MRQEAARQPPPPILKAQPGVLAPPAPHLQPSPAVDLQAFREQEDRILGTYGWVDKERQVVRIPIEEAMRLLVSRGRPPTAPPPSVAFGAGGEVTLLLAPFPGCPGTGGFAAKS